MINQGDSNDFARLPRSVVPSHYFITLRPDFNTFKMVGNERIQVDVREKTNTIYLNVKEIEIQSVSIVSNNKEQTASNIEILKEKDVAIIKFADELEVGQAELKLNFISLINDTMVGCYRMKYIMPNGEERYGLCTQFESVYCRQAFPCYDEPELKAKFDLTLIAPKDRVALSNMNIVEETDDVQDPTQHVLKFATTPIMSTYLLAYTIGEFDFIEQKSKNGVQVRVYTPVGKTEQGEFALDVAVRCLDFYEEYFKIRFPLPKVDLIAIPDFDAGAMENWGLITYREIALLFDPQNSSSLAKQWIAMVVCHELAHQWFGNLVTMKWWDDLWLNEGFACFMQHFSVSHIMPELNIWEQFIPDYSNVLSLDSLHNSHPIQVPVNHPNEIEEIFDAISYKKGASVIRMLYNFIGNENFQKGMHHYLNKFAYKNTVTDDLWDSLEEASNQPIRSMMNSWVKQKGYPIINVTTRQDGSNRIIITLSQEKFSVDGTLSELDQQTKWLVPISIISQNNPKPFKVLFEDKIQEILIENVESSEWIKLNPNMSSFYRAQYSYDSLEKLKPSIVDKSLTTFDRLNIVDDLFALVKSGRISSDRVLKFLESFVNEDQFVVWISIISFLNFLNNLCDYTDYQEMFHNYVLKMLAKIRVRLGNKPVEGEDHSNKMLRTEIISMLVTCEDAQILREAKTQFEAHVSNVTFIAPDLRAPFYRAVASNCDDKTFEQFFQLYRESNLSEEKNRIIQSLGVVKDPTRIQRVIDYIMSDAVRSQDRIKALNEISMRNKVGRQMVFNYFKENHAEFTKRYQSGFMRNLLIEKLTQNFATMDKLEEVDTFFKSNCIPGIDRILKQSLEVIKMKIDLLVRDSQSIKAYLTNSN